MINDSDTDHALRDSRRENTASEDVLLTVKEYAQLFHRHQQTVYRAIKRGKFPKPIERPTGGGILIRVESSIVKRLRAVA